MTPHERAVGQGRCRRAWSQVSGTEGPLRASVGLRYAALSPRRCVSWAGRGHLARRNTVIDDTTATGETDAADEAGLAAVAGRLHRVAVEATPSWIRRRVETVLAGQGLSIAALDAVVAEVVAHVDAELGALLATDIDRQRSTPLSVFRAAVTGPTAALAACGAAPLRVGLPPSWDVPGDPYALAPDNLADVGSEVHEAGIAWGAAKAFVHLERRRREGLR